MQNEDTFQGVPVNVLRGIYEVIRSGKCSVSEPGVVIAHLRDMAAKQWLRQGSGNSRYRLALSRLADYEESLASYDPA